MSDPKDQGPKIIVDSDWKAQAQKERERIAEREKQAKEAAEKSRAASPFAKMGGKGEGASDMAGMGGLGAGEAGAQAVGGGQGGPGGQGALPPADFSTLVGTMVTQALMYMGAFPDPETGRAVVSLEHARFHIELIGVLEEKTKGNLTAEEASDLSQAVNELRMRFVEIVQAIAQMKKEGKLRAGPGGTMIGGGGGLGGLGGPGVAGSIGMPPGM